MEKISTNYSTIEILDNKVIKTQLLLNNSNLNFNIGLREIDFYKKLNNINPFVVELKDVVFINQKRGYDNMQMVFEKGTDNLQNIHSYKYDLKDLVIQLIYGLEYIHSKNIIHRDLKPPNILIFKDSDKLTLKYADFGSAALYYNLNENIGIHGTNIPYCAPEWINDKFYNFKSDIFSLGCVIYYIVNHKQLLKNYKSSNKILLQSFPGFTKEKYKEYFDEEIPEVKNYSDLDKLSSLMNSYMNVNEFNIDTKIKN